MALTITLNDDLVAGLENKAKRHQLSAEQFALRILTEAAEEAESETLSELVARIQATPPNPAMTRAATGNLAEALRTAPDDPDFDLETWTRQWEAIEAELKGLRRPREVVDGRHG